MNQDSPNLALPPDVAAEEFILVFPRLEKFRGDLVTLAQAAWRGEWPVDFYQRIARVVSFSPWLSDQLHRWVNPNVTPTIPEHSYSELESSRKSAWEIKYPFVALRQGPFFFEGLLLLSQLSWGPGINDPAHDLLGTALAKIHKGFQVTRKDGKPALRPEKHPLKLRMYHMGRPQTIEAACGSLREFIEEQDSGYPRFKRFLAEAYLPLMLGNPKIWLPAAPAMDGDVLGVDLREAREDDATSDSWGWLKDLPNEANDCEPVTRPFTSADLVDEMVVMVRELAPQKETLTALAHLWRGENTWDFYDSVARLSYWLRWPTHILQRRFDLSAVQTIGQAIHSTQRRFARNRAWLWRKRRYLAWQDSDPPRALVTPSDRDRRIGLFHLRALLMVGRMAGDPEAIANSDKALSQVICELQSREVDKDQVEIVLERIGNPDTVPEFIARTELLLPEISASHRDLAELLKEAYLPVLTGAAIVWTPRKPSTTAAEQDDSRPHKKRPRNASVRRRYIRIPGREAPLPGESLEETSENRNLFRRVEPRKKAVPLAAELRWVHQRVWGANPLLARNHIESLCDAEADLVVQVLDARIEKDISAGKAARARTGILVALTLLTGQGARNWAQVRVNLSDTRLTTKQPRLLLHSGIFEIPVLRPENAFKPDKAVAASLEVTAPTISLHLPPTLQRRIRDLLAISMDPWSRDVEELRSSLDAYVAEIDRNIGTGITLSRVRNFARARLRDVTGDLCGTMILCGDSFGLSTAPLYYANRSVAKLEQSFRTAMWPLFRDVPIEPCSSGNNERVGSALLVTHATARELARGPGRPMHAAGRRMREHRYLSRDHNSLVNHVLCMLLGTLGHRPTAALLTLTRFDFDVDINAAIFRDKQCDPAHLYRYVPISDLMASQIGHYLEHLRRLAELSAVPLRTTAKAKHALLGHGPLFFHLDADHRPIELEIDTWRKTLPEIWDTLPLNWGRTWLSSRGRDAGMDADHLSIALGHLEATGYPFSRESPLEPAQLSREMCAHLGHLARSAGWVARKGLRTENDEGVRLEELGPLRDWKAERRSLTEKSKAFQVEQRLLLRANVRSQREEGERIAHTALQSVVGHAIPYFDQFNESRTRKSASDTAAPDAHPVILSPESLEAVQNNIDVATRTNAVLSIAAHNGLHRYLKRAKQRLDWDCPIPSPWLAAPKHEPTPFFPGLFRATAQVRALRGYFRHIPAKPAAGFTAFEWGCGIAITALCVFSFEDNPERILSVLQQRSNAQRSTAVSDLILIDVGDDRRGIGIRGLAAVAVSRLAKQYPADVLPETERLCEVLAAQLPAPLTNGAANLLVRLCATVSVANVAELSGLARIALGREHGCVAMSSARQRQFLEEGHGSDGPPPAGVESKVDPEVRLSGRPCAPSVARKQYMRLRETLFIGDGPKTFDLTGETLSQANITAFRGPLRRELTAFLAQENLSPLVASIGAFALELTANGTRERREPAWSTVYSYITSFGLELIEFAANADFLHLDPEEYIDLYQDVLDRKTSRFRQATAARELVDFHRYLHEGHGLPAVDFSDLEGAFDRSEQLVDAEVVQPQEFLRGLATLSAHASILRQATTDDPHHTRLCRQTEVFALLLRGSGARHNELAGLRFKDVLATLESTIVLIRPSRYRRLKTSSARRIVDCSLRLSGRQRRIIAEWIAAERDRLRGTWKPTLPIFGKKDVPKERIASADLRDAILGALDQPIGYRSKLHRVRHLVAGENLLAIWLSESDWLSLRHVRVHSRRLLRGGRWAPVVLPRHLREQSLRFGHRWGSTTLANYFHLPWVVLSRAHAALAASVDRHTAAVALGVSAAGADKILQRGEDSLAVPASQRAASLWLTHAAGTASATPGRQSEHEPIPMSASDSAFVSARLVDGVLRDIQRGIPLMRTCLAHGFTREQFERLRQGVAEVEMKTGFKIIPHDGGTSKPRLTRPFEGAKVLDGILDIVSNESSDDRQTARAISMTYFAWANQSKCEDIHWPVRELDRLSALLTERLQIPREHIIRKPIPEKEGFEVLELSRSLEPKKSMNRSMAWLLIVIYIAEVINDVAR